MKDSVRFIVTKTKALRSASDKGGGPTRACTRRRCEAPRSCRFENLDLVQLKKTSGEIPRTRGAIAWRLARAYAKERGITDEQAMQELFEEVTDNTTPALAVA